MSEAQQKRNPWLHWPSRWQAALDACRRLGGEVTELTILSPASKADIEQIEAEIGFSLPDSFAAVLQQFSAGVEMSWYLPENLNPPDPFRQIFSGECIWNLWDLPKHESNRLSWIESVFRSHEDPIDRIWHNKLAFFTVANGDHLAIDLSESSAQPVVYLSHEGDVTYCSHGYILGQGFADFIDRWTLVGCAGAEGWQMRPFIESPTSGLDPHGEKANLWREWFGLDLLKLTR